MTLGAYDFVAVFRAPSDEAMAELLLVMGKLGAIDTTTMTAIENKTYQQLIEGLSNEG